MKVAAHHLIKVLSTLDKSALGIITPVIYQMNHTGILVTMSW